MPPLTRAAAVRRRGQQSNEVIKRPYRTITDLPPELLHMIFSYLRPWTRHLKACSLTCRALRDVSVEYLKFPHPSVRDLPRFVEFMQSHPPILTTIRGICLGSGTRLDATLVNTIKTLFPKLDYLNLVNISFDPTLDQTQSAALPFRLNRLNLTCMPPMQGPRCSLPGMMHIISLLAPQKLSLQIDEGFRFDGRQSFGPSCIAASPAIASLRVRFGRPVEIDVATVLDALTKTLAPDTLQTVDVYYDSKATVRALGTMLARIGSSVTTLTLHASIPSSNPYKVEKWSDPFDGESRASEVPSNLLTIYCSCRLETARPPGLPKARVLRHPNVCATEPRQAQEASQLRQRRSSCQLCPANSPQSLRHHPQPHAPDDAGK